MTQVERLLDLSLCVCYHVLSFFVYQTPCFSRDSFLNSLHFFFSVCGEKIRMPGWGLPWWSMISFSFPMQEMEV